METDKQPFAVVAPEAGFGDGGDGEGRFPSVIFFSPFSLFLE